MPPECRGTFSRAGRRAKWFLPVCFSLSPSAQFHAPAFRGLLQCWWAGAAVKFLQVSPAGGSNLVRNYGSGWKVCLFAQGSPTPGLHTASASVAKHAFALKWSFPVAAWVQHSPALNKISINIAHAYKCGHSVGYLAPELCLHPSCCDSFPCLFHNCVLLNLSSVPKILNLDMERDTRDPSVYAEGNKNKITDSAVSHFAYASHANPMGKMSVGNDQPC